MCCAPWVSLGGVEGGQGLNATSRGHSIIKRQVSTRYLLQWFLALLRSGDLRGPSTARLLRAICRMMDAGKQPKLAALGRELSIKTPARSPTARARAEPVRSSVPASMAAGDGELRRIPGPVRARLPPLQSHPIRVSDDADEEMPDGEDSLPSLAEHVPNGDDDGVENSDGTGSDTSSDASGKARSTQPDPSARIAELEARVQELMGRAGLLDNALGLIAGEDGVPITAPGSASAQQPVISRSLHAVVAKPDTFTGRGSCRDWLAQVAHYLTTVKVPPRDAVNVAAGFLRDEAQKHWFAVCKQLPLQNLDPRDWETFRRTMLATFDVADPAAVARVQLDVLRQRVGPGGVEQYVRRFNALCLQIEDMSEGEKIHRFLTGLSESLRERVKLDPVTKRRWTVYAPLASYTVLQGVEDSLAAVPVPRADLLDGVRAAAGRGAHTHGHRRPFHKAAPRLAAVRDGGVQKVRGKRSDWGFKRSATALAVCRIKGLCLKCFQPGHQASSCSAEPRPDSEVPRGDLSDEDIRRRMPKGNRST
jgi:hypothetical protein